MILLILALCVAGAVFLREQRKANRERVDRLTWHWYLTSASSDAEYIRRAQQFLAYSKTAKWT